MQRHAYQQRQYVANSGAATTLIPKNSNHQASAYSRIPHSPDGFIAPPQIPHPQHLGQDFRPQITPQSNHQRGNNYLANNLALLQQRRQQQQQQQQQQQIQNHPPQGHAQIRPPLISVPDPQAGMGIQANSLTDIQPIAGSMNRLNLSLPLTESFLSSFNELPLAYKYVVENTCVFKFTLRPAMPAELGRAFSPVALFFLEKLKKSPSGGLPNHDNILGMRCNRCLRHPVYVKGCSNFLDVKDDAMAALRLRYGMQGRLRHLISCPHVPGKEKGILFGFKEDNQNIHSIGLFLSLWLQTVKAHYFGTLSSLPAQVPLKSGPADQSITAGMQNTLRSIDSELLIDMYDRLSDSVDLASSFAKTSAIVFDDLAGEIATSDGKESSMMETILENYEIRLTRDSKSKWQATIACHNCKGSHSNLSLLQDSISHTDVSLLRRFWIEHSTICSCTLASVKDMFRKRGPNLHQDEVSHFCERWKKHLVKYFRNRNLIVTQESARYDWLRPVSLVDNLTFGGPLPNYRQANPPALAIPSISVLKKDIILENELYRDLEGNKAFRNMISIHRCLFYKVSPGQKDLIVSQVIQFMEKDGFIFKTVGPGGVCVQVTDQKRRAHVRHAFEKGFPEMLRPPVDSRAPSKVVDVEYSPMVGIIHGQVCWNMNKKALSPMLEAEEIKASRHNWERIPNPRPQDIVDAIRRLNPSISVTPNPSYQSVQDGTVSRNKIAERSNRFPANPTSDQRLLERPDSSSSCTNLEKRTAPSQTSFIDDQEDAMVEVNVPQYEKRAPPHLSTYAASPTASVLVGGAKVLKETANNIKTVESEKQRMITLTEGSGKRKVCEYQSDSSKRIRLDRTESPIPS